MKLFGEVPEPLLFNPLKHHLGFMRKYINSYCDMPGITSDSQVVRDLRHLGTAVMDVYNGNLAPDIICNETGCKLKSLGLFDRKSYSSWTGTGFSDYRVIELSDRSQWTLKFSKMGSAYIHIFPARTSPHTFRVKANTLKSAVLYLILIGKDYVNAGDLNFARALIGLSPVKDTLEAEAITEMIELIRG